MRPFFKFTVFLASATVFTLPAQAGEINSYRAGKPYLKILAQDAGQCEMQCYGDAQCRGWNFIRPPHSSSAGVCEFNSRSSNPIPSGVSISGQGFEVDEHHSAIVPGGSRTTRVGIPSEVAGRTHRIDTVEQHRHVLNPPTGRPITSGKAVVTDPRTYRPHYKQIPTYVNRESPALSQQQRRFRQQYLERQAEMRRQMERERMEAARQRAYARRSAQAAYARQPMPPAGPPVHQPRPYQPAMHHAHRHIKQKPTYDRTYLPGSVHKYLAPDNPPAPIQAPPRHTLHAARPVAAPAPTFQPYGEPAPMRPHTEYIVQPQHSAHTQPPHAPYRQSAVQPRTMHTIPARPLPQTPPPPQYTAPQQHYASHAAPSIPPAGPPSLAPAPSAPHQSYTPPAVHAPKPAPAVAPTHHSSGAPLPEIPLAPVPYSVQKPPPPEPPAVPLYGNLHDDLSQGQARVIPAPVAPVRKEVLSDPYQFGLAGG